LKLETKKVQQNSYLNILSYELMNTAEDEGYTTEDGEYTGEDGGYTTVDGGYTTEDG
jgi:hypothetical protein